MAKGKGRKQASVPSEQVPCGICERSFQPFGIKTHRASCVKKKNAALEVEEATSLLKNQTAGEKNSCEWLLITPLADLTLTLHNAAANLAPGVDSAKSFHAGPKELNAAGHSEDPQLNDFEPSKCIDFSNALTQEAHKHPNL
jgi:hypothetical protein